MVETAPAAPFVIAKAKLLLELLTIALDPPAQFGDVDQLIKGNILEHGGKTNISPARFRLSATRSTTILPGVARSAWCRDAPVAPSAVRSAKGASRRCPRA